MTKKFHILLITLMLGFFAIPTLAYACGNSSTKTEKSCCKKGKADKSNKKDCCKNHKSKNNKNDDSCGGKCKHSSCSCTTFHFVMSLPFYNETKTCFIESEKLKFYPNEAYLSSGFFSIWLPPKIS